MFGEPPLTYMSKNGWWGEPVQFFVQHINNCQPLGCGWAIPPGFLTWPTGKSQVFIGKLLDMLRYFMKYIYNHIYMYFWYMYFWISLYFIISYVDVDVEVRIRLPPWEFRKSQNSWLHFLSRPWKPLIIGRCVRYPWKFLAAGNNPILFVSPTSKLSGKLLGSPN